MNRRSLILATALACLGTITGTTGAAMAQDYPNRPIRILIGFAAGGGSDILARDVGAQLTRAWGQPVVVENRTGANGMIATAELAKAAPDGYTLQVAIPSHVTNAMLDKSYPFKPLEDFTPVSVIASAPFVLAAYPGLPAANVRELIALAKAKPGAVNYGSAGNASTPHLFTELFNFMAGTEMTHIAYRGGAPGMTALLNGEVSLNFLSTVQSIPYLKDGRLKALAVSTLKRSDALPEVPTIAESGVPGYDADVWWGIIGPKGLPRSIVDKLQREIARIVKAPEMGQRLAAQGAEPGGSTPEEFAEIIRREESKWAALFRTSKIKLD